MRLRKEPEKLSERPVFVWRDCRLVLVGIDVITLEILAEVSCVSVSFVLIVLWCERPRMPDEFFEPHFVRPACPCEMYIVQLKICEV